MELKRVVVTGLGAITPIGNSARQTWEAMCAGVSGAATITRFDVSPFKTRFACEVKGFNPETVMDKKELRKTDIVVQYALATAKEAIEDAGFSMEEEDKDRIGVVWGTGMGGLHTFEEGYGEFVTGDGTPHFSPYFLPKIICDMAAGEISIRYGLRGPNYVTTSACASSTHAIADAFNLIRLGKADVMLTGGAEAAMGPTGIGAFNALHALSTRNDSPATASRPYSASRDGFVLGEGAACLILEEYEHAVARGAKIYAEVVGEGMSADAHHITAPDPDGRGAMQVMKLALQDAGIKPEQVDYINTHGTSTPLGDISELKAVKALFGEHAYRLNLSSTKSMTGHLLGATGAVEAMAAVLAVKEDIVPPTINHEEGDDDPQIDYALNFTFGKAQHRTVNYAISNTFGFGGHNACLLFKKYTECPS